MNNEIELSHFGFVLQWNPDEGLWPDEVAKERLNDTYMSNDEFAQKIEKYNLDDYLNSDNYAVDMPYHDLYIASHGYPGRYDGYAKEMLSVFRSKYPDEIEPYKIVARKISNYRITLENATVLDYIYNVFDDKDNSDKVSVLPLMCGSGKSTALTKLIINTLIRIMDAQDQYKYIREHAEEQVEPTFTEQHFDGILIVTDSKERLRKIWASNIDNPYIDEFERDIIRNYEKLVSIMTEENSVDEESRQRNVPVLCVTTQRYFGWKKEEIQKHLEWRDENGVHKRPLIIFDEQPYLNEVRDISIKTINDIDTALRISLDDEVRVEGKQWCLTQWDAFRSWFIGLLNHYEYDFGEYDTIYFESERHHITENDELFFNFIDEYRAKIRAKDNDAYNNLFAVRQLLNSWGIFNHRDFKTGEYSNKFSVFVDNRDKVTNLGAKVIVLDGTGDISPVYSCQDYIDMRNGVSFLRSLSYLTIKHGDLRTSKEDFRRNEIDIAKVVLAFLKKQGHEKKDVVFFTYKGKESKFQARINGKPIQNVAHFGDIRGKNDFVNESAFAQVGMNRMQPIHYLVHTLARHEDMREELAKLSPEKMHEQIKAIYQDDRYIDFMTFHVLADTDQCMFRSAIRDANNAQDVTYYIFYKHSHYPRLHDAIVNRYQKLLGAEFQTINERDILEASGEEYTLGKLRKWRAEWDGKPIKLKMLLDEKSIKKSSFYTTINRDKSRNGEFSSWLDDRKQDAKDMGLPSGWYAINPNK